MTSISSNFGRLGVPSLGRDPFQLGSDTCACPVCGGLECLCRPRFFAGQLLTEEDLNRLDRYLRGKHRLHNRYLHGWGTVCGLEVLCHRCPGWVNVTAGYALDPCGKDIIVCADEELDFCGMIKECRQRERRVHPCDPPRRRHEREDDGCQDLTECWLLFVEYEEKPTRGITSLRGPSGTEECCDCCRCGGRGACGCQCHEKTNGAGNGNGKSTTTGNARRQPTVCEPTVVCETYEFGVCRLPDMTEDEGDDLGPLINRILACWLELIDAIDPDFFDVFQKVESDQMSSQQAVDVLKRTKQSLERFLNTHPTTFCDWDERLLLVVCPEPDSESFGLDYIVSWLYLTIIIFEYLIHCFCSAWLPQCPGDVCDARVPLAKVTVTATGDCRVIRICNLTRYRHFVRTAPNMKYWFSPLQIGRLVREALESLCCQAFEFPPIRDPRDDPSPNDPTGGSVPAGAAAPTPTNLDQPTPASPSERVANIELGVRPLASRHRVRDMGETILRALMAEGTGMNAQDFYRSLTGTRDADGKRLGSIQDLGVLPAWFAGRAVARPLWEQASPEDVRGAPGIAGAAITSGILRSAGLTDVIEGMRQPSAESDMAGLRRQLSELQREVAELRNRINE